MACMCKGFRVGGRVPLLVNGVSRAPLSPFTDFLVDTKTFLAMKGYVTFVQVTKSKMKIISY